MEDNVETLMGRVTSLTKKVDSLMDKVDMIISMLDEDDEDDEECLSEDEVLALEDNLNIPFFHNYGDLTEFNGYLVSGTHYDAYGGRYVWILPLTEVKVIADLDELDGNVSVYCSETGKFHCQTEINKNGREDCIDMIAVYCRDEDDETERRLR